MKKKFLIDTKQFHHLPFLYKYIKVLDENHPLQTMKLYGLTGKIPTIQNENAELTTFYKCISRV